MLRGFRIDGHAADGVKHARFALRGVMMAVMVIVAGVAAMASAAGLRPARRRLFRRIHRTLRPLETYTLYGYIGGMRKDIKASVQKRLGRIEGQVRGLSKMVDEDRYCIDIVTQISAVRAALRRVEEEVLRDHVAHCVEHAIASGNKADQREKITELMEVIGRSDR
jgi:DNA-binding FrmR family transcriptional regulator